MNLEGVGENTAKRFDQFIKEREKEFLAGKFYLTAPQSYFKGNNKIEEPEEYENVDPSKGMSLIDYLVLKD